MSVANQSIPQDAAVDRANPADAGAYPGTQCTPHCSIQSITRHSPAPPLKKIGALAMLLHGLTLEVFFGSRLKVSKTQFFLVVNGKRESKSLRERIAGELTVSVSDIWPHEQVDLRFHGPRKSRPSA